MVTIDAAGFDALLARANGDPAVIGLVLTGSRGAGLETAWSDYDVRLIVRDDTPAAHIRAYRETDFPHVDLTVMTRDEFARHAAWNSPEVWDRYAFVNARVLIDPTGAVAPLVHEKGRLPEAEQRAYAAGVLDAFINSVYRALKCDRKGNQLCVRLESAEAISHALPLLFAWEGRIKPYPVWLEYDLRRAPLTVLPLSSDELLDRIDRVLTDNDLAALQVLFVLIVDAAGTLGYGEVVASWGDDLAFMRAYTPENSGTTGAN